MRALLCEHADIRTPAEVVFDHVCDLSRWPAWFSCVVWAVQPQHRPLELGEEIHVCMHAGRRRWQEDLEVTRFIRNAFLSFEAFYSAARRIDFRFERRGQLTRLACSIGYPVYGGAFPAMYHAIVKRRQVAKGLRDSLTHLKNVLEEQTGATVVDDLDGLEGAVVGPPRPVGAAPTLRVG